MTRQCAESLPFNLQSYHFDMCVEALHPAFMSDRISHVALKEIVDIPDADVQSLCDEPMNASIGVAEPGDSDDEELENALLQENAAIKSKRGMGTPANRPFAPKGTKVNCGVCDEINIGYKVGVCGKCRNLALDAQGNDNIILASPTEYDAPEGIEQSGNSRNYVYVPAMYSCK